MMTSLCAPVGVVVLDSVYLTKEWPVKELRRLMELLTSGQVRVLPVMYNMSYKDLGDLLKRLAATDSSASDGASSGDADMLEKLKRITMIHSNTDDVVRNKSTLCCVRQAYLHARFHINTACRSGVLSFPEVAAHLSAGCLRMQDEFLETISFAVLRRLVEACEKFATQTCREHETIFVSNVHNAVKYVCDDKHFLSLSRRDAQEAKEWLEDLSSLYRSMQEVRS